MCSLRGVEQILAAAEVRRAAAEAEAEAEAGAPRLNLSPVAVAASLLSRVGAYKQGELLAVARSLCLPQACRRVLCLLTLCEPHCAASATDPQVPMATRTRGSGASWVDEPESCPPKAGWTTGSP